MCLRGGDWGLGGEGHLLVLEETKVWPNVLKGSEQLWALDS